MHKYKTLGSNYKTNQFKNIGMEDCIVKLIIPDFSLLGLQFGVF
jgi:hypothetical protein